MQTTLAHGEKMSAQAVLQPILHVQAAQDAADKHSACLLLATMSLCLSPFSCVVFVAGLSFIQTLQ